jgi:hypothetical protein
LINEERANAGKKSVGFINPVLYANPSALNDIKKGNNPGCLTEGFTAVSGWDPVTGMFEIFFFLCCRCRKGRCDETVMLTMRARTGYAELPEVVEGFYETALKFLNVRWSSSSYSTFWSQFVAGLIEMLFLYDTWQNS